MKRLLALFLVGIPLGAIAGRNASGTFTLFTPGNPVVTLTTISSSWANNTLSDIAQGLTDSLDRASGRGCMQGVLQLANGTVGAPSATFCSETSSGLFRLQANTLQMSVNGNMIQQWSSLAGTQNQIQSLQPASGNAAAGLQVLGGAGGASNGNGGSGLLGNGGQANGSGGNGIGVVGLGFFSGQPSLTTCGGGIGAFFEGQNGIIGCPTGVTNSAAPGLVAISGAVSGSMGAVFQGAALGSGTGLWALNGTAATGATRTDAISLRNGDLDMSQVAYPTSTTGVANRLTPASLVKAWAAVLTNGSGGCTVVGGFNVASCTANANNIQYTFATALANTNYSAVSTSTGPFNSGAPTVGINAGALFTVGTGSVQFYYVQQPSVVFNTATLSAGTKTVGLGSTVVAGTVCVCTDTTANNSVECTVPSGSTFVMTGTASDVIAYSCGSPGGQINPSATSVSANMVLFGQQ